MPSSVHTLGLLALFVQQNCGPGGSSCTAGHILQWLYWIAGVLAVILLLVIVLAVRLWRRNKDADLDR